MDLSKIIAALWRKLLHAQRHFDYPLERVNRDLDAIRRGERSRHA